jgi:hypothetical protein
VSGEQNVFELRKKRACCKVLTFEEISSKMNFQFVIKTNNENIFVHAPQRFDRTVQTSMG